ncbi:EamA family transporter [Sporosarcina sp. PTS2304]|uniref:DMT family transporter n=1 Tax=Sporosarcina sp. PTS2304 TaxID=2283194 RepID=UPI000E0DCA04|nr:EamA family transporter [Sporosarcina sp. PTS2304]AXI00247.1 EamA family transporter [Sporosarcina sp. PTS2304]
MSTHQPKAYLLTISGAICWGLIGLFIAPLYVRGFTAWDVVAIRGIFSFTFLLLFMLLFYRKQLRTQVKDHVLFASAGILSLAFFNYFYFEVFSRSNLSLAVTLLYTGPLFVTILSRVFFKEPLTTRKILALVFAIIGCAFVVGLLPFGSQSIPIETLVMGILSGFCYALYSIFTKPVTKRYSPLTITTYTFFYMALFMALTSNVWSKVDAFVHIDVWISALLLALVSTVAAYVLYTYGLKYLEAGKASILATIEPIVAVLVGVLFLSDLLRFWQVLGIILVLYAAVLVVGGRVRIE